MGSEEGKNVRTPYHYIMEIKKLFFKNPRLKNPYVYTSNLMMKMYFLCDRYRLGRWEKKRKMKKEPILEIESNDYEINNETKEKTEENDIFK